MDPVLAVAVVLAGLGQVLVTLFPLERLIRLLWEQEEQQPPPLLSKVGKVIILFLVTLLLQSLQRAVEVVEVI